MMNTRAYLLLDVTDGEYRRVMQTLKGKPGVTMLDALEGPPDILVMLESHNRQELAELTVSALASVENLAENIQLLPRRDGPGVHARKTRENPGRPASNSVRTGGG